VWASVCRPLAAPGGSLFRWAAVGVSAGGYLSLSPVGIGVYERLNVGSMIALVGDRIYDDVPQAPTFPFVWYEVLESQDVRGFGGGGFPEVQLRVHAFSTYEGSSEAQAVARKAIELLRDQELTVTGYAQAGTVFYDQTLTFSDQIIQGVKVREVVAQFRVYVEETT